MGIISVSWGVSGGPGAQGWCFVLTLDPVDGVSLQCLVGQLKDLPQVGGYPAQLKGRAVDEFIHVVKQIYNPITSFISLADSAGGNYR